MARVPILLGRSFGKGRSAAAGLQSICNLYAESVEGEERTDNVLHGTPGKGLFADFSAASAGSPRGQLTSADVQYYVRGTRLYSVNSNGTYADLGEIEGSAPVAMSYNGQQLDIVAELKSYSFNVPTVTLTEIGDSDFEQASDVASLASRSLFAVKGTGRVRYSSLLDSTAFNGLSYFTAEAESDALVGLKKVGNEIVLGGKDTTEWWYATGDVDTPYARTSTAAATVGWVSRDSAVVLDNGLTFVGRDGKAGGRGVYRATGYTPEKISTPEVDNYLESVADPTTLRAFPYQQRGRIEYILTSPQEWTLAWVLSKGEDGQTRSQWCPRKSGLWTMGAEPSGGWDARTFALNGSKQIVGSDDGNLYELQADTYTENGVGIVREATSQQVHREGRMFRVKSLELDIQPATALTTGQGSAPVAMMALSVDGGASWSSPRTATMGAVGQTRWRCIWRNVCGGIFNVIFKFRVSDPIKVVILGAWADIAT